jgi:hypothetical protein
MTRFNRKDYETVAAILREESIGHEADKGTGDLEFGRQECLESLVEKFIVVYTQDNRLFDSNRFRMNSLGYLIIDMGDKNGT